MTKSSRVGTWLCRSCVYYTVLSGLILLLQLGLIEAESTVIPDVTFFLRLFPAALCFSFGDQILCEKKTGAVAGRVLHAALFLLPAFLLLWLPACAGKELRAVHHLIAVFVFALLYTVYVLIKKWILFLIAKKDRVQ